MDSHFDLRRANKSCHINLFFLKKYLTRLDINVANYHSFRDLCYSSFINTRWINFRRECIKIWKSNWIDNVTNFAQIGGMLSKAIIRYIIRSIQNSYIVGVIVFRIFVYNLTGKFSFVPKAGNRRLWFL